MRWMWSSPLGPPVVCRYLHAADRGGGAAAVVHEALADGIESDPRWQGDGVHGDGERVTVGVADEGFEREARCDALREGNGGDGCPDGRNVYARGGTRCRPRRRQLAGVGDGRAVAAAAAAAAAC